MELKVLCDCGQKFKFDVEPVQGRMPFKVNCPSCQTDATPKADLALADLMAPAPAAKASVVPASGGLRIQRAEAAAAPPLVSSLPAAAIFSPPPLPSVKQSRSAGEFNLGLGVLGAVIGAAVGVGLMYGFFLLANFRFPLMGTCVGALTGLGARILFKGTDSTLGGISAAIAVLATCGVLYLMYGELGGLFIISIGVSGYFAYRVAG